MGIERFLLEEFFVLPDVNPQRENILEPNEIITQIHIPKPQSGARSLYIKIREKGSFDFALVSVAAVFEINGQTMPECEYCSGWSCPDSVAIKVEAEAELKGHTIIEATAKAAGRVAIKGC